MMRPRVIPIVITAAISAGVLFGGWAIYNQVALAAPLEQVAKNVNGVIASDKPVIAGDKVTLSLELADDASLRDVYEHIEANGKKVFDERQLILNIKQNTDKELDEIWFAAMFDIAEAMENKTYSGIPAAMNKAAAANKDVEVTTEMDDVNVYVTLRNSDAVKYVVLPRMSVQLEAW
ncbi:hypothetical protein FHS16_001842 [Paenibacillus endophyticus]|uniref:Uncharacterized protein n=1 Tax=Paenibacillus endophyticus TaxID=1294268 RepID=A0A7W5G9M4_9BACL|nr:hypothetical protein [Paenibacillus endophyticus]MBB3151796.1 hypothetical protein [Paenibacillus endophyticus]